MLPKTIQIIGSLNMDLITRTPRHPSSGETLTATSFTYGPGGKGANQAVACARLSRSKNNNQEAASASSSSTPNIHIDMIGAVGNDFFGHHLLSELKANGVDTTRVQQTDGEKTGTAVVIVEEDSGENRILITPGANASVVSPPSLFLPSSSSSSSSSSMTSLPELIILQLEIPLTTVVSIMETAREKGIDVLLNPAPAVGDLPRDVYKGLKHLIMNETEAALLMGALGSETAEAEEEKGSPKNAQDICQRFHALGVTNVIITLGAKGVYYSSRDEDAQGCGHVRAAKVETVVDTTAAGDAFVGAYAVAVVGHGAGVAEAVRWANRAGARTVEKEGAMGAIPWGDEVGGVGG